MVNRHRSYGIAFCALLGVAAAQSVDLKGTVHDRFSSQPLGHAKVSLGRLGHQATTDSAGRFHILHVPSGAQAETLPARLRVLPGKRLTWHAPRPGAVTLQLLDPMGGARWKGRYALPEGGDWELRIGALPPGLYVAILEGPGFRHTARVVLLGEAAEASGTPKPTRRSPPAPLAKGAAVVDTLLVTREGYRLFSLPIASLEQAGLALLLSDTAASRADLVRLEISGGSLEPPFSSHILSYRAAVREDVPSLRLTLEAGAGKPSIRVNGVLAASGTPALELPLSLGRNTIAIALTSQDSSTTLSYALDVHRAYDDSAALSNLIASTGTLYPDFRPEILTYSLQLPPSVIQLSLTASAFQPLCSLSLNGQSLPSGAASPAQPLAPDTTTLTVSVASPDRARQVSYLVRVSRPPAGSDDASLKSITLSPSHPGMKPFHRDTLEYVMHVEPWDSVYAITAIPNHSSAILDIRDIVQASGVARQVILPPEWSNWWIDVTSADGTRTRRYNVTFYRQIMLRTPVISGPNVVTAGAPARFSTTAPGIRCGEFETLHRMATATGDTVSTRRTDSIPYTWTAPGIYAVRLQTVCFDKHRPEIIDAQSPWSNPKFVTVETGDASSRVRRITGVRSSPETWSPDTTYIIASNSRFDSAALLTILPGTWVMFSGPNTYLEATALSAVGSEADSIHFVGGIVRLKWNGALSYHADGGYRAGPRFEYCSLKDVRLTVTGDTAAQGGYGPYLKNSYVMTLAGDTSKVAVGTYAERCRIENVDGMRFFESRFLNSHLGYMRLIADPGRTTEIRRCDIQTLSILASDFRQADIAGNTIRRFGANYALTTFPGKLSGNNLLSAATANVVTIGGSPVDMRGNWWGEAVTAEMEAKGMDQNITIIQDGFDDAARAKADYGGWLTAPVPDAAPDW